MASLKNQGKRQISIFLTEEEERFLERRTDKDGNVICTLVPGLVEQGSEVSWAINTGSQVIPFERVGDVYTATVPIGSGGGVDQFSTLSGTTINFPDGSSIDVEEGATYDAGTNRLTLVDGTIVPLAMGDTFATFNALAGEITFPDGQVVPVGNNGNSGPAADTFVRMVDNGDGTLTLTPAGGGTPCVVAKASSIQNAFVNASTNQDGSVTMTRVDGSSLTVGGDTRLSNPQVVNTSPTDGIVIVRFDVIDADGTVVGSEDFTLNDSTELSGGGGDTDTFWVPTIDGTTGGLVLSENNVNGPTGVTVNGPAPGAAPNGSSQVDEGASGFGTGDVTTDDGMTLTYLKVVDAAELEMERFIDENVGGRVDFNTTNPSTANQAANDAGMLRAIDWMCETGGRLRLGGGQYSFSDPVIMPSYFNLAGAGMYHTHIFFPRGQAALDTDENVGPAHIDLRDFQITNHFYDLGVSHAEASANTAINLKGGNTGPRDPKALDREGVQRIFDPYHRIHGVSVQRFHGDGIALLGRGECLFTHNVMYDLSGRGFVIDSPDNWLFGNSVSECGLEGLWARASNTRYTMNKWWYTGQNGAEEGTGAGARFVGSGQSNIIMDGDAFQDNWGPAIWAEGEHVTLKNLNITEAGGGRLTGQGGGFAGARSLPRSTVHVNNAKLLRLSASLDQNDFDGAGNRPLLVYDGNSGSRGNCFDFTSIQALRFAPYHDGVAGFFNSKRGFEIWLNKKLVAGQVALADVNDAAASWNDPLYMPEQIHLEDGRVATRNYSGAGWRAPALAPLL